MKGVDWKEKAFDTYDRRHSSQQVYPQISSQVLIDNHSVAPILHDDKTRAKVRLPANLAFWILGHHGVSLSCIATEAANMKTKKKRRNLPALATDYPSVDQTRHVGPQTPGRLRLKTMSTIIE